MISITIQLPDDDAELLALTRRLLDRAAAGLAPSPQDYVAAFLNQHYIATDRIDPATNRKYEVRMAHIYAAFLKWAELNGYSPMSCKTLACALAARGFTGRKTRGVIFRSGLRPKPDCKSGEDASRNVLKRSSPVVAR